MTHNICDSLKRYCTVPISQTSLLQAAEAEEVDAGGGAPADQEEADRGEGDGREEAAGEEDDEEGGDAGLASLLAGLGVVPARFRVGHRWRRFCCYDGVITRHM